MSVNAGAVPKGSGDFTELSVIGAAANWQAQSDLSDSSFVQVFEATGAFKQQKDTYDFDFSKIPDGAFINSITMTFRVALTTFNGGEVLFLLSDGTAGIPLTLDQGPIPSTSIQEVSFQTVLNPLTLQPYRKTDFSDLGHRFGLQLTTQGGGSDHGSNCHRMSAQVSFEDDNLKVKTLTLDPKVETEPLTGFDAWEVRNLGQGADPRPARVLQDVVDPFNDYLRAEADEVVVKDFMQAFYANIPSLGRAIYSVRLYTRARGQVANGMNLWPSFVRPDGTIFLGPAQDPPNNEAVDPTVDDFRVSIVTGAAWESTEIRGLRMALIANIPASQVLKIEVGSFWMEIDHGQGPPRVGAIPVTI